MNRKNSQNRTCSLGSVIFEKNTLYVLKDEERHKVSSSVLVTARVQYKHEGEQQTYMQIRFRDHDNRSQYTVLKASDCFNQKLLFNHLVDLGWRVYDRKLAKALLLELFDWSPPSKTLTMLGQPGWHTDSETEQLIFAYGHRIISQQGTTKYLLAQTASPLDFREAGNLVDWQRNVARLFDGNPRMMLLLAAAFAGPVIHLARQQNIGVLLYGPSRSCKTLAMKAATTVFGPPTFIGSWKSTSNALLVSASLHNDLLFSLDELSQAKPADASDAAYDIMNGMPKARLSSSIKRNHTQPFRVVTIATGEHSLPSYLAMHGLPPADGQLARLLSIPVSKQTVFETTHGLSPNEFISQLISNINQNYGTAGPVFINYLVEHQTALQEEANHKISALQARFAQTFGDASEDGYFQDIAKRFAVLAYAGELAIRASVLPFAAGAMSKAIKHCLREWLNAYQNEVAQRDPAFYSIQEFFAEYQHSFPPLVDYKRKDEHTVYKHEVVGVDAFLVNQDFFKAKFINQYGKNQVIDALNKRGLLIRSGRGGPTRQISIPHTLGMKVGFYVIAAKVLTAH